MADNDNAFDSPDTVEMKGPVTGVTRLSKKAKALVALVAMGVLGFILFSIYTVDSANDPSEAAKREAAEQDAAARKKLAPAKPGDVLKGIGDGQASYGGPLDPNAPAALGTGFDMHDDPDKVKVPAPTARPTPQVAVTTVPAPPPTPEEIAARRLKEERDRLRADAMRADLAFEAGGGGTAAAAPVKTSLGDMSETAADGGPGIGAQMPEQDDQNKQLRKERFLREAQSKPYQTYLQETKRIPLSQYELQAGWAIPAALECGINSDLPGQICARVRENVYDTKTGRYLLIPQGTKLIGAYDSQIAVGQERVLAVWNRLIFPDGSSLSLQGMPGANQGGYAGFDADVDNHYMKVFGGAILMSVITAGVQLSQPQQSSASNNAPSTQQTMAGALGQQLGQVGSAVAQRNLQIQPTLKQKPGYRFNVIVTKDIIFPGAYGKK